jgi:superfamily II DNA or RNA helicase
VKRWEGRILGLTATPERADGAPLGNLFEEMIISTTYGELIERGLLRDLDIWRPDDRQDSGQLAMDPVEAYRKLANGRRAFVFCDTIERCNEYQAKLSSSATVTSEDDTQARDWAMAAFREGLVNVLFNVYTLTEGVDVPEADVCILARNVGHHSLYLQIVGRVLRGNGRALLVDLPGVSHVFGGLSEPRLYSLDKGIELEKLVMAKDCPQCGTTSGVAWRECPQCKWRPDQRAKAVQITNAELRDVYQGEATPEGYKEKELMRLVNMCLKKNQSLYWAANQYKKLFKEWPAIPANEETKLCEMTKLLAQARQRGAKRSWASVRFKQMFGHWPPR